MDERRSRSGRRSDDERSLARVMTAEEMAIWPYIFSDAYVVDLDFSAWQRSIALYLTADEASETRRYYPAAFLVEFQQVREWNVAFSHLGSESESEALSSEHFYWNIRGFTAQSRKQGVELVLWGDDDHPRLFIICGHIAIREIPKHILEQIRPGWGETPRRFIRPSIEQLARDLDQ